MKIITIDLTNCNQNTETQEDETHGDGLFTNTQGRFIYVMVSRILPPVFLSITREKHKLQPLSGNRVVTGLLRKFFEFPIGLFHLQTLPSNQGAQMNHPARADEHLKLTEKVSFLKNTNEVMLVSGLKF